MDYDVTCPDCGKQDCIDQREVIMRKALYVTPEHGLVVGDDYDADSTAITYECWECGAEPTEDEIIAASIPTKDACEQCGKPTEYEGDDLCGACADRKEEEDA